MALHKFDKGLDLPLPGKPTQVVRGKSPCTRVALMADDYPGMKPGMQVVEGQTVQRGQLLFEDRKQPGVRHTSPAAGRVIGILRGEKRALQAVVIDLSDGEFALLRCFVTQPQRVLSRDQLLDQAHGGNREIYDRAVDSQVSRLRRKLNERSGTELIRTIRNEGYMLLPAVRRL